jgi:hypothetical protein
MTIKLARIFRVAALGTALLLGAATPTGDTPVPAPAPLPERDDTPAPTAPVIVANPVCPEPTPVVTDENQRPWIAVDAFTRDGVPVRFQLNLSYRPGGEDDITTLRTCDGLTPHIMGLAKIAYAREILAVDYTALPGEAAAIMRRAAMATEKDMRAIMGPATPAITGMGIREVIAPGLPAPYAQAMMTGRLELPAYNAPRFIAATHGGLAVEYKPSYTFAITPDGYEHFGPLSGAIHAAIDEAIMDELRTAVATRETSCLRADAGYIAAQAYADASARLRAAYPGLSLLSLDIGTPSSPAGITAPPIARGEKPICIKGIAP